ncbi:hypothetical protein CVS40_1297 [Lucilia cuprina]|nr:hypothetical protein CVS40_1297 [Lucilia cuprina]
MYYPIRGTEVHDKRNDVVHSTRLSIKVPLKYYEDKRRKITNNKHKKQQQNSHIKPKICCLTPCQHIWHLNLR